MARLIICTAFGRDSSAAGVPAHLGACVPIQAEAVDDSKDGDDRHHPEGEVKVRDDRGGRWPAAQWNTENSKKNRICGNEPDDTVRRWASTLPQVGHAGRSSSGLSGVSLN